MLDSFFNYIERLNNDNIDFIKNEIIKTREIINEEEILKSNIYKANFQQIEKMLGFI